jgi:hypothetical protein
MKTPESTHEIYAAVDHLIGVLRNSGQNGVADVLHHRLRDVAWSTSSELLTELRQVLRAAMDPNQGGLAGSNESEARKILDMIEAFTRSSNELLT